MATIQTLYDKDGNPVYLTTKVEAVTNNQFVRIITTIDNFTAIVESMAFDIRDEDAKPFMDALFNLINSI